MDDKQIALFLLKWGRDVRVVIGMACLIVLLSALNIWLCCRRRRLRRENESVVEWTQNLEEVEVDFPIPEGTSSRDIECRILPTSIRFCVKTVPGAVLEGTLYRKVRPDECNWQLWPVGAPKMAKLTLVKAKDGHWKSLLDETDSKKHS
ncbi:hypothetical protein AB1Y20_016785 [Prymnesium parvum]|uniref:CS domain-containing protein n=1 Tax=Prymnesium parvum TaxID=97485 RepID=A0AB34ICA7_PRYPA|mmetsp:Transcript_36602/g.91138  ORF Transcript_36602/g.91138 Transcript_36602/m.91138 type:complete len:149 (-) Transcript_36602:131-577(-)